LGRLSGRSRIRYGIAANKEEAVLTSAESSTELGLILCNDLSTGRVLVKGILLPPLQVDDVGVSGDENAIALRGPEVAALKRVAAQEFPYIVRGVNVEALALEGVKSGGKVVRNVGEAGRIDVELGKGCPVRSLLSAFTVAS